MATLQYSSDEIGRKARRAFEKKDYKKAQALNKMYAKAYAAEEANAKDGAFEGFGDTFMRGIDQAAENFGETARVLGKDDLADSMGGLVDRRPGKSAASQFMNEGRPLYDFSYFPKAAVEQTGQFIGSLGSRAAGAGVGAAAGSVIPGAGTVGGALVGAFAGPMVFEGVQQLGPIAMERARNNGRSEPNKQDFYAAATSAAGIGMLNAIAPGMSGIVKRMLAEGGTEALQSVGEQAGSTLLTKKGLEVSPRQAIGEGLLGAGSAGIVDTTIAGASKVAGSRTRGETSADDLMKGYNEEFPTTRTEQAAADLSKRLALKIDQADADADFESYDVQDVDPDNNKGAKGLIDNSHSDMNQRLKTLIGLLKDRLKIKKSDTFDQVIEKSDAALAAIKSKNKVKNVVEPADFAAFEKIAGDTQEGQEAISLMHEMNALTNLYSGGLTGGVTQYTDALNPIGPLDNYSNTGGPMQQFARPLASIALGLSNPALSAAQIGTFGAGRLIDKATGRRSNVARYIDQNANQPGQPAATGRSLQNEKAAEEAAKAQAAAVAEAQAEQDRVRQEQMAAEDREANIDRVQKGAPPNPESPEGVFRLGTGLDRTGIARVIRILKGIGPKASVARAIQAYETSVATGGKVDFALIRDINLFVDQNGQQLGIIPGPRNNEAVKKAIQTQETETKALNYQLGVEANRNAAQQLINRLNEDDSVRSVDKASIEQTLRNLQTTSLGQSPLNSLKAEMRKLEQDGVDQAAVQTYLGPYAERVQQQQAAKDDLEINEARIIPVPRGNSGMQAAFGVTNVGEGGNFIDLDSKEDLTGNTYAGGLVKIVGGKPVLETSDIISEPATKDSGNKVKVNLFKQKAGWKWIDYDGPNTIVSTEQGSKHHYSLSSDFQTPVTLQTYPKQPSEPRLRPTSQGNVVLGNKIGSISVRGKVHPVYDQVTVQDKRKTLPDSPEINASMQPSFTSSPSRISPAMPTGKSPLFDSNVEKTPVSLALINQDPTLPKRIVDKMRPYVPFRDAPSNDQSFLEQAVDFMTNNLVALYYSVSPEYRDRSKLWYVGANKLSQGAADTYGQTLEAVAGVMSALSPGLDWYVNYDIGVRLLNIYTNHQDTVFGDAEFAAAMKFVNSIKAKTPRQVKNKAKHKAVIESIKGKTLSELTPQKQAYFVRFHDVANATERGHRIVTPEGELGDFVLNKNGSKKAAVFSDFPPIATAMAILADPSPENISALMGIGHKRRNFYNNILDPMNDQGDVTIDTHAVGAALFLPLSQTSVEVVNNFGTPDSKNIGSYGTYGVYAEAYRRAAAEVDILPREMQSITWEAARGLFPASWKGNKKNVAKIRTIWEDYKNGKLSLEKARKTVYETAGNIRAAQWEDDRPNFSINERNVVRDDSGSIPRSSVPRGDQLRSGIASTGGVLQSSQEVNENRPALLQYPPTQIPFNFVTPTVKDVKENLPKAKAAVEMAIGKPGTKLQDGLRNIFDVQQLADILDISIGIFRTQKEFMDAYPVNEGTKGLFAVGPGGVSGKIAVVEQATEGDSLFTMIHEIAHPLEARPPTNEPGDNVYGEKVTGTHPEADDKKSTIYRGSMRHRIRVENEMDTEIAAEIDALQNDGTMIQMGARPDIPPTPIRLNMDQAVDQYQKMNPQAPPQETFSAIMNQYPGYKSYTKQDAEFAVDPLFFYLVNPKAMKKKMPKTFKMMQSHFNESSIPIKLYTQPLATIVAIVMAGILVGQEEEENPGALAPQPGALTV